MNNEQLIKNDVLLRYNMGFFLVSCYLLRIARFDPRRFCFKPTLRSLFLCNFYVSEKTSLLFKRVNCFVCRKTFYDEKTGHAKKAGEKYTLPKLAETMKIIAKEGADAVYHGSLTSELLKDLKQINSIITAEDLSNYKLVAIYTIYVYICTIILVLYRETPCVLFIVTKKFENYRTDHENIFLL